jgi:hypothetical protein
VKNTNPNINAIAIRRTRTCWLLVGLLAASCAARATCNASISLTRPDSRYKLVEGATPTGSEVRDNVTGLVWQRCLAGMTWDGTTCTGTASSLTWALALDVARTATASTATAATTWRMPNHAELYSLAERACYDPAINTTWFPATPSDWAWSSSPYADSSDIAWLVYFHFGYNDFKNKSDTNRVRLVRSSQ